MNLLFFVHLLQKLVQDSSGVIMLVRILQDSVEMLVQVTRQLLQLVVEMMIDLDSLLANM